MLTSPLTLFLLAAVASASGALLGGPTPRKGHSPLRHGKVHPVHFASHMSSTFNASASSTKLHSDLQKQRERLSAGNEKEAPVKHARLSALLKAAGNLPAMREATSAEHRASAHKKEMRKLRASHNRSHGSNHLLEHNKHKSAVALLGGPTPRKLHRPPKHGQVHFASHMSGTSLTPPGKVSNASASSTKLHSGEQKRRQWLTAKNEKVAPVKHAKAPAATTTVSPDRKLAQTMGKKAAGNLPAMHEATQAELRASAHKKEMRKLRAFGKQTPVSRNLLEHNKHNRAVASSNSTLTSANMCTAYGLGTARRACCDCKFSGRQTSGYGDTPANAPYCCYSYMTGSTHTWATVGAPSTAAACYPTETCYDARF